MIQKSLFLYLFNILDCDIWHAWQRLIWYLVVMHAYVHVQKFDIDAFSVRAIYIFYVIQGKLRLPFQRVL